MIQSNDVLMAELAANPVLWTDGESSVSVRAIYKGHTFRPLIYPLNLNQLTLEVPHSYLLTAITETQISEKEKLYSYSFGETYNNECNTFSYDTTINQRFRGGSVDSSFLVGEVIGTVYALAIQSDGKIVVGGDLKKYDGYDVQNIFRVNTDGSIDLTFNSGGLDIGFDFPVYALAIQSDGKIVVGGDFGSYYDGSVGDYYYMSLITRLNTDGSFDTTFNTFNPFLENYGFKGRTVRALAIQNDGKIIAGGNFQYYDDGTVHDSLLSITRINTDGSFDTTFNSTPFTTGCKERGFLFDCKEIGYVFALAIQSDGKIVCGGLFNFYNDFTNTNIMWNITRLNTDGTFDTTFNTYNPFLDNIGFICFFSEEIKSIVYALDIQPDGKIIVGGRDLFCYRDTVDNYNGFKNICRLNVNGTLDTTFDYLNGGFDFGIKERGTVYSVKVQNDGSIMVGGEFGQYQGTPDINYIAQLTSGGTLDTLSNIGTGLDYIVFAMAIQSDYKVMVGGAFDIYQGTIIAPRLLRISGAYIGAAADGDLDTSFSPTGVGFAADGEIYTIAEQPDGKLVVGGSFIDYSGITVNNIVRLNDDGSIDDTFNPGGGYGFNDLVESVALQSDGKIVVGGKFTQYSDINGTYDVNRICRLNTDGTIDLTFNNGISYGMTLGGVSKITIQSNGKILVGGGFTQYVDSGATYDVGRICRLNTDGTLDTSFVNGLGLGFDSTVFEIVIQPDDYILVGGSFSNYNDGGSYTCNYICRLNPNGYFDSSFVYGGGYGFDNTVYTIALQNDGSMVVGGDFSSYQDPSNSYGINFICRLGGSGYLDTGFVYGPFNGFDNSVYSVVLQSDDKILVGGYFTQYIDYTSGFTIGQICRLNTDGSFDTTFNTTGTGFAGGDNGPVVYTMVLDTMGKLTIGGNFTSYNGSPAPSIARMFSQIILTYTINNKELRLIVKYTKLQKYDLITTPIKISLPRGSFDNKFVKLIPADFNENFEQIVVNNLSHNKRKQLRPGSSEIYLAFYDLNTKTTSLIPNYKIITTRYGDNEVFRLIRGNVVINSVAP